MRHHHASNPLIAAALLLAGAAHAAPFLTADAIPLANAPNVRIEYRIDGGAWSTAGCVWVLTATTRQAFCDLAGTDTTPTASRKYEARYAWDAGVGGDGVLYTAGVSGVSAPFSAPWRVVPAPTVLQVVPSAAP